MLEFCSLYSGSSGNSLFVKTENSKILIDSGTSCKKICEGLASINSSIEDIDAIFITHEHSDHVQSLGLISSKYNIPVFLNQKTWDALGKQKEKISEDNVNLFTNDRDFNFKDLIIHPFSIPHDAADPCGYNISDGNKMLSIATDIGHMTENVYNNISKSSFILLESNYELELLRACKYPYMLKQRISGPNGHLSNVDAGKTIAALMKKELKEVSLGHLSKESNFPEMAYQTVVTELMSNNCDLNTIRINVASRNEPGKIIKIL